MSIAGLWINNYVAKLNNECRSVRQHKIAWTADNLQLSNMRQYCRKIGDDTNICWSCLEILKQYETDYINKYELNGVDKLNELIASQAELHKKMDTILQLLQLLQNEPK